MANTDKRDYNGQYAIDVSDLDRMCRCGHRLGEHSGSRTKPDCLFYSLPESMTKDMPGADNPNCGCTAFKESRASRKARLSGPTPDPERGEK